MTDDLDKFFEELEEMADKAEIERLRSKTDLDRKILDDFHGFAPTIDESFQGQLPTITPKAQIFISENLGENQYFRFGVEGGGCSGFNYLFDIDDHPNDDDVTFSDSPPAIIDSMSLKYLMLKVSNPGAKASCGCGTSFAFDEDLLDLYENV
jgi:iron-sulfur cluster assembly accessory protein